MCLCVVDSVVESTMFCPCRHCTVTCPSDTRKPRIKATSTGMSPFAVISLAVFASCLQVVRSQNYCNVEGGESVVILDIEESRGNQIDQSTFPPELPITGNSGSDIVLEIEEGRSEGGRLFRLSGKRLRLTQPLDREDGDLSSLVFQLSCTVISTGVKRNIPVIVRITDVNDHSPAFLDEPYEVTIDELTPIGTTIFRGIKTHDPDSGSNGLVEFSVVPGDPDSSADGFGYFSIPLPHRGEVIVNHTLDYENTRRYFVQILARDRSADVASRRSSTTVLTVNIRDNDDRDPTFFFEGCALVDGRCVNPEYTAEVVSGKLSGVLEPEPEQIRAVDGDSLNAPIRYSFLGGAPSFFGEFFAIDSKTGRVSQIKSVERAEAKRFELLIKAEEETEARRYATAKLSVNVLSVDNHPPYIEPAYGASDVQGRTPFASLDPAPRPLAVGFVKENAPVGTVVRSEPLGGDPVAFRVRDDDLMPDDPSPDYVFELTTTAFAVNSEGILVVNQPGLDRDPPNPDVYNFQLIARERDSRRSSSPVSFSVRLLDENDNLPRLPVFQPITVPAGVVDRRRPIFRVKAEDNDEGKNAELVYSIVHVSNGGRAAFDIDSRTGDIRLLRQLLEGQQYSVTLQATDGGGRSSQGILDVQISRGPNRGGPTFPTSVYDIRVSEGAAPGTAILSLNARDPEGDRVTYSLVSATNDDPFGPRGVTSEADGEVFRLDPRIGVISLAQPLDREARSRYTLLVRAEDSSGLSNTAEVNIIVTDINDRNPEFINQPYEFRIRDGRAGEYVGSVKAVDADLGLNAEVSYTLSPSSLFTIDGQSGRIETVRDVTYEDAPRHALVVTAYDGGREPRIATATVLVTISDTPDDPPVFRKNFYEASVPENRVNAEVVRVEALHRNQREDTTITYELKNGKDFFRIDPQTGVIYTTVGLDYEREQEFRLTVGTRENQRDEQESIATVVVQVTDVNDIPPTFVRVPGPIRVLDVDPVGIPVGRLEARDADGSSPGNVVRYSVIGEGKAPTYFAVDEDMGVITVKDDLRKEIDSQYRIQVRAADLGTPTLAATATVTIFVEHTVKLPYDEPTGFAELEHTVEVEENSQRGTFIKRLGVLNRPPVGTPFECSIYSGNELGHFYVTTTGENECELHVDRPEIDFERRDRYTLGIEISTLSALLDRSRHRAMVTVNVVNANDNAPEFRFPLSDRSRHRGSRYYAFVSEDAQIGTSVMRAEAVDDDRGSAGQVLFSLLDPEDLFIIEPSSGIVRTKRTIPRGRLGTYRVQVKARDSPEALSNFHETQADAVINVVRPPHRSILSVPNTSPEDLKSMEEKLIAVLEEHTGYIIGVERIEHRKYLDSESNLKDDSGGSDVWFHVVDPRTGGIISRNDSRLDGVLSGPKATSSLLYFVNGNLGISAQSVGPPIAELEGSRPVVLAKTDDGLDGMQAALIALAILIFALSVFGVFYICCLYRRYQDAKEDLLFGRPPSMVPQLPPLNYDVLQHSSDGNSTAAAPYKEYETQVLAMTVQDDANGNRAGMIGMSREFHMDTSTQRNHFLDLDKVDYISRDGHSSKAESLVDASIEDEFDSDSLPLPPRGSHRHPPNSVTTSQAYVHQEADVSKHYSQAEEVRNRKHAARRENLLRESLVYPGYDDFPPAGIGQRNPLYESGTFPSVSSETGTPDGSLNVCATNENIIFKQKKIQGEVEL